MTPTAAPLRSWSMLNKRTLLRCDLNVPFAHNEIANDFKLRASEPTIAHILNNGGTLLLVTHRGKDQTGELPSTAPLLLWFKKRGYDALFARDCVHAYQLCQQGFPFVLLENERLIDFNKHRESATQLALLCHYYVNDAFGSLHRESWSLTVVPYLFPHSNRSIGFLVEKELLILAPVAQSPQHPFVAIIGGNKFEKIVTVKKLLPKIDSLLTCPLLSEFFTKEGTQTYDASSEQVRSEIMAHLTIHSKRLLIPEDYLVKIAGSYTERTASEKHQGTIISIGTRTANHYASIIRSCKTLLFNGLGGFIDDPESLHSTKILFQAMAESRALSIVAGGDSSAAALNLGFEGKISLISTGGGATMAYLAGLKLPALAPFTESLKNRTEAK